MMGPQQGQSNDVHVDAIDLTLSSPEPEVKPQARMSGHMHQQQPTGPFKEESGKSHRVMHSRHEPNQRQSSTRSGNVPQQPPRRINPQHVKQIIDTSSHRALRSVVLQLCKTSPALSGALVRGLAPHSPWAQGLIRGQQARSQVQTQPTVKTEPTTNDQDAQDRMERRFGTGGSTQSSTSQNRTNGTPVVHQDRDRLRLPHSAQKPPNVKRERRPSPTDSDDSTNIVDFPEIERTARRHVSSHHEAAHSKIWQHSDTDHSTERSAAQQRVTQKARLDRKPNVCSQCGELYKEGEVTCYYHTGRETPTRPGDIPQFTCCNKFLGEPGCRVRQHISESNGSATNAKRPSPSPHSGAQWSKKPRVL